MKQPAWPLILMLILFSVFHLWVHASSSESGRAALLAAMAITPQQSHVDINKLVLSGWTNVESRLASDLNGDFTAESYRSSDTFAAILEKNNNYLWNTMMHECEHPILQVAGFLCICQRRPSDRIKSGLCILANAERPASPMYSPIYDELGRATWKNFDYESLDDAFRVGQSRPENLAAIMQLVPTKVVAKWLQAGDVENVSSTAMSFALDSVLGDCEGSISLCEDHLDELGLSLSKVYKILNSIAVGSDHSGLVYLMYANDSEELYMYVLRKVLSSPEISDIEIAFLISRRAKSIEKYIEQCRGNVPEKRFEMMEKIIKMDN